MRCLLLVLLIGVAACTLRSANQAPTTGPVVGANAGAQARLCPTCGQSSAPTDSTKAQWAKVYRLFRCGTSHEVWVLDFETRRVNQVVVSDPCPSCGQQLTWNGETLGEGAGMVKVLGCPSGHSVSRRQ